jgi:hypothetical protein
MTPKRGLKLSKKRFSTTPKGSHSKASTTPRRTSVPNAPKTPSQETSVTNWSIESRELFPPSTPSDIYVPFETATTPRRRPNLSVETEQNDSSGSFVSFNPPMSAPPLRERRDSDYTPRQRSASYMRSPPAMLDDFIPHPSSTKRAQNRLTGDNDTWIEIQVVMTRRNERRKRSLFYSVKTQMGVWDEPPSGASNIVLRNEMQSMADEFALAGRDY